MQRVWLVLLLRLWLRSTAMLPAPPQGLKRCSPSRPPQEVHGMQHWLQVTSCHEVIPTMVAETPPYGSITRCLRVPSRHSAFQKAVSRPKRSPDVGVERLDRKAAPGPQ